MYDEECEIEAIIWGFSEAGSREEKRCGIVMDGQGCFEVFTAMKMVIISMVITMRWYWQHCQWWWWWWWWLWYILKCSLAREENSIAAQIGDGCALLIELLSSQNVKIRCQWPCYLDFGISEKYKVVQLSNSLICFSHHFHRESSTTSKQPNAVDISDLQDLSFAWF